MVLFANITGEIVCETYDYRDKTRKAIPNTGIALLKFVMPDY
jgi:hypothetical protein